MAPRRPKTAAGRGSEDDGLHGGPGRAPLVLLADAARDQGGRGHAHSHRQGIDELEQGFGQAHRRERFGAETSDEEGVTDREHGLPCHLQDHGNRKKPHRAVEASFGKILFGAPKRFFDGGP